MTQISKDIETAPRRRCCKTLDNCLEAVFFKALGDPNRLAILVRLAGCRRAATVSEIACCYPVDLSVVSRHLSAMRDAGIVTAEKRGREVYYAVNHRQVGERLREMADAIDACCPPGCCGT